MTENFTLSQRLWSLERKCSHQKCEPGCLVIGERTKLHSCISCCNESLCNTNNSVNEPQLFFYNFFLLHSLLSVIFNFKKNIKF